jgi:hypothetical protein
MSNRYTAYNEDVKRDFLEKNMPHNRQVKAQKAALLASLESRSRGVKARRPKVDLR